MPSKTYLLSAMDFQDPKMDTLWGSQRTAVRLPEEDDAIFAGRIDRTILELQGRAWMIFEAPVFRTSVKLNESQTKAVCTVEVIDGIKRELYAE